MNFIRHLLISVQFFSRLPIPKSWMRWADWCPQKESDSLIYAPAVGLIVGICCSLVWLLAMLLFPTSSASTLLAAALCVASSIWLTGALHEDGLADLIDGLGGSPDRARALEIMKDSRIGTYGGLALILATLIRILLIGALGQALLNPAHVIVAICLVNIISRAWPLGLVYLLPNVGDLAGSKTHYITRFISSKQLLILSSILLVICFGLLRLELIQWQQLLLGLLLSGLIWLYLKTRLQSRLGGYTGDGLGAAQQLCEIGLYIGFLIAV
ncbi:adenosylcobinamide-GDP ribazoletransferase [Polynucleobacter sp. IMCC30063]|uniref:adenosylcobinamide-GDP ribazoletransferase n=1 Tax=Polynucleobacter sp. IMCC30063 TaxID=2907298 RepID=UPI001F473937|nr:adenosylcobinamide-GDP ribazoletransferase [Polynucleobacter sp. IMCC30063]MCE7506772.1 adenosylcobinamide-GDP ribazoletransferase [Polynucleobacter sp. IMCC30063]